MTSRLGRWLASLPIIESFVDWTIMVRMEIAADQLRDFPPPVPPMPARWPVTEPGVYSDGWTERLAAWGISDDPLDDSPPPWERFRGELTRVRAILDGASPSDFGRPWGEEVTEPRTLSKEGEAFDRILRQVANERLFGKPD
jgi:hypothetical protein